MLAVRLAARPSTPQDPTLSKVNYAVFAHVLRYGICPLTTTYSTVQQLVLTRAFRSATLGRASSTYCKFSPPIQQCSAPSTSIRHGSRICLGERIHLYLSLIISHNTCDPERLPRKFVGIIEYKGVSGTLLGRTTWSMLNAQESVKSSFDLHQKLS